MIPFHFKSLRRLSAPILLLSFCPFFPARAQTQTGVPTVSVRANSSNSALNYPLNFFSANPGLIVAGVNGGSSQFNWSVVNKSGANLTDLATRNFSDLQNIPAFLASPLTADLSAGGHNLANIGTATAGTFIGALSGNAATAITASAAPWTGITGKPAFATVATSGAYSDLSGKPSLSTVATTGAYSDLTGKPTIPAAQVNSDWNASSGLAQILNKPTLAAVATSGAYSDLSGKPGLSTVATTGAYSDLTGKPTIPAAQVNSDWNASSGLAQILNKPALGTAAAQNTSAFLQPSNNLSDLSSAATSRTNLGATTAGANLFQIANPGAVAFPEFTSGNGAITRTPAQVIADLNLGPIATVDNGTTVTDLVVIGASYAQGYTGTNSGSQTWTRGDLGFTAGFVYQMSSMNAFNGRYTITNLGVGGRSLEDLIANETTDATTSNSVYQMGPNQTGRQGNILIDGGVIVNEARNLTTTAATFKSNLETYLTFLKSTCGYSKVYMLTAPVITTTSAATNTNLYLIQEQIDAYNRIICVEPLIDAIVDIRDISPDTTDGNYFYQGLHPVTAEYTRWASLVNLAFLTGSSVGSGASANAVVNSCVTISGSTYAYAINSPLNLNKGAIIGGVGPTVAQGAPLVVFTGSGNNSIWGAGNIIARSGNFGNDSGSSPGCGMMVKAGTNGRIQTTSAMSSGSVTVSNTSVDAGTSIFVGIHTPGGSPGAPYVSSRTNGTGFTVTSTSSSDASTIDYLLVEQQ